MKSKHLLMALLAGGLAFGSCTSTPHVPEGKYLIAGMLKNVLDSTIISLYKRDGKLLKQIQTDTVINGKFSFQDTVSSPSPQQLMLLSHNEGFPGVWLYVWVQSGKYVQITGEDRLLPLWKVSSEIEEQQATNDFMALCPSERKRSMQWHAQESDLFRAAKGKNIDWKKIDSLRTLYDPLDSLIYVAELNYMKDAPITATWLNNYQSYSSFLQYNPEFGHKELIRSLYARMSEADKATEAGQIITGYMNLPETVNVGDEMADGDLYDLDGNVRHLSEFKGKYILLDFWSQGCGPCLQSLPEMEEVTEQYKNQMVVVSISQDSEKSWKEFIAKQQLKGNQWNELLKGNTGLGAAYQVTGIPHYVMISPDGKVKQIWSGYGKGSLKAKMKELIQ